MKVFMQLGLPVIYRAFMLWLLIVIKKRRKKCRALAAINKVEDRVVVKGCFDIKELMLNNRPGKTLFIIDCEGCENEIITKEFIAHFINADLVIELHYEQAPMILSKLGRGSLQQHTELL